MDDALSHPLARLASLTAALGNNPDHAQLEQLRSASAALLAASKGQLLGAAQQKRVWEAAAGLWNASIDLQGPPDGGGEVAVAALLDVAAENTGVVKEANEGSARRTALSTLLQSACELCSALALGALLPAEQIQLVRFHCRAGEAWARLGQYESAEAVLSRGSEAAAALAPLCFERRGRGPQHQEAAALVSCLQLERLRVALQLKQQMLATDLVTRAAEFAGDARLPASEGLELRLALIQLLSGEGRRLAQAGDGAAAVPLLSVAYETLSHLELPEAEAEDGVAQVEGGQLAAEVQGLGAQVLTLLAWCSTEAGEPERALSCLQALQQVGGPASSSHFSSAYLSLRCLLQLGRLGEAQAQLLDLVSHEDVTPEACLAGLQAALQAPGGTPLARAALSMVLERFSEEPSLVVELVRTALQAVASSSSAGGGEADGGAAEVDHARAAQGQAATAPAAAEVEELVLELVGDDRLMESVCEGSSSQGGGGLPLRRQLLALLWNHAVHALAGGTAYAAAHAFFSAALQLLQRARGGGGASQESESEREAASQEGQPQAVVCCRSLALCCLGIGEHDRALQHLETAERLSPGNVPTAMLRLSAQLAAGMQEDAAATVTALSASQGADADVLRIACCQCVDAGAHRAARQALEGLLERCAAAGSADGGGASSAAAVAQEVLGSPGYEATVFQNLVRLLLDSPLEAEGAEGVTGPAADSHTAGAEAELQQEGDEEQQKKRAAAAAARRSSELAGVMDRLVQRVGAVGAPAFFALDARGGSGRSQLEWLALQAWNAGQRAGGAGDLQPAAVLLAVCGELYAALPGAGAACRHRQKTAFLMAAAAATEVYQAQLREEAQVAEAAAATTPAADQAVGKTHGSANRSSASLNLARSYLQQASAAGTEHVQQAVLGCGTGGTGSGAAGGAGSDGPAGLAPGGDAKADVFILLLDFKLCCLVGDPEGQLKVLERAKALPAFTAHHFAMAAALARAGTGTGKPASGDGGGAVGTGQGQGQPGGTPGRCVEVLRAAEAARLDCLTGASPLDYAAVAGCLRSLLELSPSDPDKLRLLGEAGRVLATAPPGAYPQLELRWLVTVAWNRGAVHARFGRAAEARRYQRWAADALQYDAGMAEQYKELMEAEMQRGPAAAAEGHGHAMEGLSALAL